MHVDMLMVHLHSTLLCMQAQAHYPLVDVFAVSSYLDDLATECRARIAASGAHTDLERLAILNQLMFNPPAGGRCASCVIAVIQATMCAVHVQTYLMPLSNSGSSALS